MAKKILKVIKTKLVKNPFLGKKLVGDLSPFYRLRVGDYRILYDIADAKIIVTVVRLKHRKEVYK